MMIRTLANRSSSAATLWTRNTVAHPLHQSSPQAITAATTTTTGVRGMATKKAGGSTNNGRDSIGRRLGVKILHKQPAKAGSILVRQRGQKFRAGENVGMGTDHTLFAKIAGVVRMEKMQLQGIGSKKRIRNVVHVDSV